jgi:hypothetical protein
MVAKMKRSRGGRPVGTFDFLVLAYVEKHPGATASEIVAATGIGKGQVSDTVIRLTRNGLIARTISAKPIGGNGKRVWRYAATLEIPSEALSAMVPDGAEVLRIRSKRRRSRIRFEERVAIELQCAETSTCRGVPMRLVGNLSLREAGADATRLGYECPKCFQRVMVSDAWSPSTPAIDAAHDEEP